MMPPTIGLALGSGAARGWAHIGVIEGLATIGIKPHVVAGTSIGALVGAALVTGKLAPFKSRVENFNRRDVAAMLDVDFSTGGLIEGRRIETFLKELEITGPIEGLPYRYGAVATNLSSGREVWMQKGPIWSAVRASIAMPGVLAPTRDVDGESWLIDGGLVDPVPVSLARAMGADIVIAVDLNSDLVGRRLMATENDAQMSTLTPAVVHGLPQWMKEITAPILGNLLQKTSIQQPPRYFEVLANSLNIMQDRITRMRLAGDPPEVLLCPRLGDFSWFDFHRAGDAFAAGKACVDAAEGNIRRVTGKL